MSDSLEFAPVGDGAAFPIARNFFTWREWNLFAPPQSLVWQLAD